MQANSDLPQSNEGNTPLQHTHDFFFRVVIYLVEVDRVLDRVGQTGPINWEAKTGSYRLRFQVTLTYDPI
jgi:hypothetical protein